MVKEYQLKLIIAYIKKARRECRIMVKDTDKGKWLDIANKFAKGILDTFGLHYCTCNFKIINKYYPFDNPGRDEGDYAKEIYNELIKSIEDEEHLKNIPAYKILKFAARDYDPDSDNCSAGNILPLVDIYPLNFYHYYLYYDLLIDNKKPAKFILKELYAANKYKKPLHSFYWEHDYEVLDELRKHFMYIDDFVNDIFMKYMDLQKGYYVPRFLEKKTNLWYEKPEYYLSQNKELDAKNIYKNLELN